MNDYKICHRVFLLEIGMIHERGNIYGWFAEYFLLNFAEFQRKQVYVIVLKSCISGLMKLVYVVKEVFFLSCENYIKIN